MRRGVVAGILAILLLFLGSLAILDQFDAPERRAPTDAAIQSPEVTARTQGPPVPPQVSAPRPPPEVARQLAAPPAAPVPVEPVSPLPPSGAPPAPSYFVESMGALQGRLVTRCGQLSLRLGDQLRRDRQQPNGHAVLLLEVEPQDEQAKIWGVTLQEPGTTRPSLVACTQLYLRGLVVPVTHLRRGERVKVQVVVGTL